MPWRVLKNELSQCNPRFGELTMNQGVSDHIRPFSSTAGLAPGLLLLRSRKLLDIASGLSCGKSVVLFVVIGPSIWPLVWEEPVKISQKEWADFYGQQTLISREYSMTCAKQIQRLLSFICYLARSYLTSELRHMIRPNVRYRPSHSPRAMRDV